MSDAVQRARLLAARWECDRHRETLVEALADWRRLPAPDIAAMEQDSALRRLTDQILYRFTKLQDTLGERLVPATLGWLREAHEGRPMRDRLDRLEKLGFLDVEAWLQWRDVRNRLAHEYPDHPALRFNAVLATIGAAQDMVDTYQRWTLKLPA